MAERKFTRRELFGLLLPSPVRGMSQKLPSCAVGVVAAGAVPFGRVALDASRCTGCGLCAASCTTGALSLPPVGQDDSYQMMFQHELCVACNACVEACPEKCLKVERALETGKLGKPPVAVFEDSVVRCRQCGSLMGTLAMRNRLSTKVAGMAGAAPELCPVCQLKAEISSSVLCR